MGIKGIRDLLKKQLPSYEERVPMKDFENKKIVVDASLFICMYKAARKEMYEEAFMTLFAALLEHNIHPTFVFDGQSPKEKSNEKKKRAEKKDASSLVLKSLRAISRSTTRRARSAKTCGTSAAKCAQLRSSAKAHLQTSPFQR